MLGSIFRSVPSSLVTLFMSVFLKTGLIFYLLFRIPHTMEPSRRFSLVKQNMLLKIENPISSLKPKSGPLFCLYVTHIAGHLVQYRVYRMCLRFGQISNVPLCFQSLWCFRMWKPALKTPKVPLLCNFAATVKSVTPQLVHLLLSLSSFSRCLNVKLKWKATAVWKL